MNIPANITVVTGAAGGLGSTIVESLLRRGDFVVAGDLEGASFGRLLASLEQSGISDTSSRLLTASHDVTSTESWASLRARAREAFGEPNVLVNNAGISPKHDGLKLDGLDIPLEEWRAVVEVNLTGVFLGIQTFAPAMKQANYGRIVNMSSLAGRNGGRIGGIHYAATKTGVLGITRAFAQELASFGVTVNAVAPGRINSGMATMTTDAYNENYRKLIPVGRLGSSADVAYAVAFLTAPEAGFITGTTTDVNGGTHMQ